MTKAFRSVLLFSLLCFLTLGVAWGQQRLNPSDSQFIQNFGVDSINLQSLTVGLNVPVIGKQGMIPFGYSWDGASSCTKLVNSGTTHPYCGIGFQKDPLLLWDNTHPSPVSTADNWELSWTTITGGTCAADGGKATNTYTGLYVVSAGLTTYYLPSTDKVVTESGGTSCVVNLNDYTLQGGVHVVGSNNSTSVSVTFPNGSSNASNFSVTDTFGNQVSFNASSLVYTDTLGNASFSVNHPGGTSFPIVATYHDTGNTAQPVSQVFTGATLKTVFGCSGAPDTTVSGDVLSEVDYPDGNNIYFTYEPVTGGVTGRIYQITYRTGGTAAYTYGSINCASMIPSSITRTTADGATSYTFALNGTHGTTTTVLDPGKNKTVYTFQGTDSTGLPVVGTPLTLTEVQVYQNTGTVATPVNTLLSTTIYCYNNNATACPTTQAAYPILHKDVYVAPGSKATYSRTHYDFDSYGNTTTVARYSAFVAVGAGTADNTTTISYGSWAGSLPCPAVGSGIVNLPCDVKTTDSASHTLAESRHTYTAKGFPANVSRWSGSTWITSYASVNAANGTVANTTNSLGQVTNYSYAATGSGGCNAILPTGTSTTLGSATLTTSATFDCNMGKLLTATDANSNTSTFTYDLLGRPLSQADPLTYTLSKAYPSATSSTLTDSTYFTATLTVDGLGRPIRSQRTDGASYDTASTAYGFTAGTNPQWQVSTSQPCITTLGADCTKNHFGIMDPLGRSISSSTTSNETVASAFNQNDASATLSPFPTGEHNKTAQTEYDGMGRVISTCALQTTGGTACGQVDGNSGILTSYAYSYNSTGTTNVIVTRGSQTHQLIYDTLGRLVFQTLPESGSTTYTYDLSSASCGSVSSPGYLVETIDNAGVHVCYNRDLLGRVTEFQTPTPLTQGGCFDFIYGDQWAGTPLTNAKMRLADAVRDLNCNGGHDVDEIFQYDPDGRTTDVWETTPHSGGQYHSTAAYALNGQLTSLSGVPGASAYTVVLDSNGRPYSSKYGTTVVGHSTTYNAAGQTAEIDTGTGSDKDVYTYDANTGLMKTWAFTINSVSENATLTWNANRSLKTLAITDGFNAGGTQTCHYNPTDAAGSGYDDVGRLVGVNCGALWTQTYTYDQYNNFSKSGTTNWNPGYSATNNHITGAGYDSDGQVTYDLNNSYAWDSYHKMITANAGASLGSCGAAGVTCITYDPFGRPVEKNVGGTITEFLYSPVGLTAIMSGMTVNNFRIPVPGGAWANDGGTGFVVHHSDWLGSSRVASYLTSHTVYNDEAYTPYAETYAHFGSTGINFTGLFQDSYSGLYDTPNREFDTSSGSRWLSPDPARASWNAYSYPTNPNSMIDPSGMDGIDTVSAKRSVLGGLGLNQLAGMVSEYDPQSLDPLNMMGRIMPLPGSVGGVQSTLFALASDDVGIHTVVLQSAMDTFSGGCCIPFAPLSHISSGASSSWGISDAEYEDLSYRAKKVGLLTIGAVPMQMESITLYHGSMDNAEQIMANGLSVKPGGTFTTPNLSTATAEAARNAPYPAELGGLPPGGGSPGVIGSTMTLSEFNNAGLEVSPYLVNDTSMVVLRTSQQVGLFNQGRFMVETGLP